MSILKIVFMKYSSNNTICYFIFSGIFIGFHIRSVNMLAKLLEGRADW